MSPKLVQVYFLMIKDGVALQQQKELNLLKFFTFLVQI